MNFDNQGIVSKNFETDISSPLGIYGNHFTEVYYKMHCITIEYTNPLQKYWNYTKWSTREGHKVLTLAGKATKCLD